MGDPHDSEKLTRYAFGDLTGKERDQLEQHVRTCEPCQEYLSFVQDFNADLREAKPKETLPGEPCPDPLLLVALEEGELDNETAEHIRAHMLFCRHCRTEYEAMERLQPKVVEVALRAAGRLIEVFRAPEAGAWQLLPAVVTVRGKKVPVAPFRVAEMVVDRDRNKSKVALRVEEGLQADHVRVVVESDAVKPEWKWKLSLLDGKNEEWTSMPLDRSEIQVTSGIPFGLYALEIRKDEDCLGTFKFTVENFSSEKL